MAQGQKLGTPERDWLNARAQYESGDLTLQQLADRLQIPFSTLRKRAWREHWRQSTRVAKQLIIGARAEAEQQIQATARQMIAADLAPLIEREKQKITKLGLQIGKQTIKRVQQYHRKNKPTDLKAESDGARAAETGLRMARVSLGMSDGTPAQAPLSPILINHSAVQIVQPAESQ